MGRQLFMSIFLFFLTAGSIGCLTSARAVPRDMNEVKAKHLFGHWHITSMRDGQSIPDFAKVFLTFKPSGAFKRGPITDSTPKNNDPSANLLGVPPCGTFVVKDGHIVFTSNQIDDGKPWTSSFSLTDDTLTLERDPFLRWGKNSESCRAVYTYRAAK